MSAGLIGTRTTGTWTIDPAHSDVGFVIRHLMISNIKGHFTKFEGQIVMPEDPLKSEVTATIDMTSIDTANATRDKHLRSPTSSTWTGTPRCAIAPPASGLTVTASCSRSRSRSSWRSRPPCSKALARLVGVHNRYGHTAGRGEAKQH